MGRCLELARKRQQGSSRRFGPSDFSPLLLPLSPSLSLPPPPLLPPRPLLLLQALLLNQPRVQEQPDGSVVVAVHALLALPNVVRPGESQQSCLGTGLLQMDDIFTADRYSPRQ
jgi:hypothetical protein